MDMTNILAVIWAYVDPVVVGLVIVGMEVIKRALPTPEGAASKSEVSAGITRSLPLLALLLGIGFLYLKSHLGCATNVFLSVVLIKGILSGAIAAYIYRTYKVSILGG